MKDEIKKIGELLKDDDKSFYATMDASPVMLWITEGVSTVYLNKSWLNFTGRTLKEELGKGWLDNLHPEDKAHFWGIVPPAFHAQVPYEVEFRLKNKNGEYRWILEQGTPVFRRDGTFRGFVGGCIDINNQVMEQERLKNSFIADVTHELRTPLAIIKGNVDLALRDKSKASNHLETLRAINVEVKHLSDMLSDLTILTSGKKDLKQKMGTIKINLSELIQRVVERCNVIATSKHIHIYTTLPPNIVVNGERMYLEKLFSNILRNAIVYGKEKGSVSIDAKVKKKEVIISIVDDGIGIQNKDIPHIFERFYRTDDARNVNHEGTGLGLAISKWIVDSHNGTISVKSKEKKGTTFTITLPVIV
jgi:PAS domain S-box-containing protein